MKVRMIRAFPGMCDAKPLPRIGGEIELSQESAEALIRIKVAELVESEAKAVEPEPASEPAPVKRGPGRPKKVAE
jgi:hypothetical protein